MYLQLKKEGVRMFENYFKLLSSIRGLCRVHKVKRLYSAEEVAAMLSVYADIKTAYTPIGQTNEQKAAHLYAEINDAVKFMKTVPIEY